MCTQGIMLKNGLLTSQGAMDGIIQQYLMEATSNKAHVEVDNGVYAEEMPGYALSLQILDERQQVIPEIPVGQEWSIKVRYKINQPMESFIFAIGLSTELDFAIRNVFTEPASVQPGVYEAMLTYSDIILSSGRYSITVGLSNYEQSFAYYPELAQVFISDISFVQDKRVVRTKSAGLIINPLNIHIDKLS
jgi:hypothetical protein